MHVHAIDISVNNANQLITLLKEGLPTDSFDKLKNRLDISDNALATIIQISKRTLTRRREIGKFRTDESERVLRLAQVYDMAVDVLGTEEKATSWMKKPARGLGGRIPLEYADTAPGADEVIALLGRIGHGVFPG